MLHTWGCAAEQGWVARVQGRAKAGVPFCARSYLVALLSTVAHLSFMFLCNASSKHKMVTCVNFQSLVIDFKCLIQESWQKGQERSVLWDQPCFLSQKK